MPPSPRERRREKISASEVATKTTHLTEVVRELEYSVEKLTEINKALWEIVKESFKLDDEYLARWVDEVRRKTSENKEKKSARLCKQCGRPLERRQPNCLYCGAEVVDDDAFSTL